MSKLAEHSSKLDSQMEGELLPIWMGTIQEYKKGGGWGGVGVESVVIPL